MNCSACGNVLSEGTVFCEFCGVDLRSRSGAAVVPSSARTSVAPSSPAPSATAIAEMGGILIKRLSLGEKFAGAGALAATIGFFLPWISTPDLKALGNISTMMGGAGIATTSYSGMDAAKIWGGIYLILASAIASAVLFFISGKANYGRKLLISGFQVMLGSLYGPGFLVSLLFIPFAQSVAGIGFWLAGLGFTSIAVGGLVTINQVGKMGR